MKLEVLVFIPLQVTTYKDAVLCLVAWDSTDMYLSARDRDAGRLETCQKFCDISTCTSNRLKRPWLGNGKCEMVEVAGADIRPSGTGRLWLAFIGKFN
jgi:hypothetical protein